jgi:hypothetical protein
VVQQQVQLNGALGPPEFWGNGWRCHCSEWHSGQSIS